MDERDIVRARLDFEVNPDTSSTQLVSTINNYIRQTQEPVFWEVRPSTLVASKVPSGIRLTIETEIPNSCKDDIEGFIHEVVSELFSGLGIATIENQPTNSSSSLVTPGAEEYAFA